METSKISLTKDNLRQERQFIQELRSRGTFRDKLKLKYSYGFDWDEDTNDQYKYENNQHQG